MYPQFVFFSIRQLLKSGVDGGACVIREEDDIQKIKVVDNYVPYPTLYRYVGCKVCPVLLVSVEHFGTHDNFLVLLHILSSFPAH